MPFDYYRRLSKANQAIYRKSDQLRFIALPQALDLTSIVKAIESHLVKGNRREVQAYAQSFCDALAKTLKVPSLKVQVLLVRPSSRTAELHGLYTREEGKRSLIQVWMKTAAYKRVVRFRTFLRTLLHEFCHHLDYELLGLKDSFHTEGFFARESSLMSRFADKNDKAT